MLEYARSPHDPGRFDLRSNHPGVLAAVPDAFVQVLGLAGDVLTLWATHPSEQVATRDTAYADERQELGHTGRIEVVETLRPRQHNVVWIDRFHLLATAAPATVASRVLGLYVGSGGSMLLYVHHPASTFQLEQVVAQVPHSGRGQWDSPGIVSLARIALYYDGNQPNSLQLACAPSLAGAAPSTLDQLARHTAGWT